MLFARGTGRAVGAVRGRVGREHAQVVLVLLEGGVSPGCASGISVHASRDAACVVVLPSAVFRVRRWFRGSAPA
jgi:hypothetical protein